MQCNATSYPFNEHGKELVRVCNAMQNVHCLCYSSMHNVRSLVQCNATCYLFTEHGKELDLVCNAMQKVHTLTVILARCYICYKCTTLDRFCNAMQCNATCYLFNEHGKELDLVCNAMQCKRCIAYVTLQCTTLDRLCNAMQNVISFNKH